METYYGKEQGKRAERASEGRHGYGGAYMGGYRGFFGKDRRIEAYRKMPDIWTVEQKHSQQGPQ